MHPLLKEEEQSRPDRLAKQVGPVKADGQGGAVTVTLSGEARQAEREEKEEGPGRYDGKCNE